MGTPVIGSPYGRPRKRPYNNRTIQTLTTIANRLGVSTAGTAGGPRKQLERRDLIVAYVDWHRNVPPCSHRTMAGNNDVSMVELPWRTCVTAMNSLARSRFFECN